MSTPGATNAWLAFPIAVLVIVLVTASTACVARCVGVPCHGAAEAASVPPCHKEKPSEAPSETCKQSVLVAAVDSLTLTKAATVILLQSSFRLLRPAFLPCNREPSGRAKHFSTGLAGASVLRSSSDLTSGPRFLTLCK